MTALPHSPDCWLDPTHHDCAVAKIEDLTGKYGNLEDELLKHTLMWFAERKRREAALRVIQEQAEDEGLWFVAERITEAYLQAALRRLHAAIEVGEASDD